MSQKNLSNPFPCLLDQGLLPPDNEGIVTKHVAEQHNVFSRVQFIIMASKLMVEEVEQVEHLMKNILMNRDGKKVSDMEPCMESDVEESESIDNVEGTKNADKDTNKLMKLEEEKSESNKKVVETALVEVKNEDILSGDLILIEAFLIEFCISIKIHLILIEMMKMLFDPIELYFNRSTGILSFQTRRERERE